MEGEDNDSEDEGAFCSKPAWQRIIIVAAGAIMNVLLGVILMLIVVLGSKHYVSTQIDVFTAKDDAGNYLTEFSGLKAGDTILKINGTKVHIGDEVSYEIFHQGASPVSVTVIRDGQKLVIDGVQFPVGETSGLSYGMRNFYLNPEAKTFGNTIKQTFYGCINSMVQVFDSIWGLIIGRYGFNELSGPIGIGGAIGDAAEVGTTTLLNLVVLLAMNLGIFNLLPVPALDGGRLVFLSIEAIRGKPIPRDIEANIHAVGMLLLLGLIGVVAIKDIIMYFV